MNLNEAAKEIREILNKRRQEIELTFIEDEHVYYMKDNDGVVKNNYPSVSKIIEKFYTKFDAPRVALRMSKGDVVKQEKLLAEWNNSAVESANLGSRVHFELETELVKRYGNYKNVRQPIYTINEEQKVRSDKMIDAGRDFLNLINERGGVLLDTEIVLGDPEEGYVGQPDKVWLFQNKKKDDYGLVITDYKSNKPKNFEIHHYTGKMLYPFNDYHDNALGHYYIQLPLYGRLLLKMLKGSKYENIKLLGSVIVLLKDDSTFIEYKVPQKISETIMNMDLSKYIGK
jgi:hypothetical protein